MCQHIQLGLNSYGTQLFNSKALTPVRKMIFSITVFATLLDYLKIVQVAILGDLHV
jgi:hypothetical protein